MTNQVVLNTHKRLSKDELSVNILGIVLIGIFALICVIPFYLIIIASFTSETSLIRNGYPLLPSFADFSLDSYKLSLKNPVAILKAYGTTIGVTAVGTFLSVFLATMTGYVLSRKDFPWRNKFAFFYFFTTLFNG
ncbi:MAG: carbohydrate ABC transporter permease, partial [Lachnospiraceae bacterium]|nr:carbohydrate ABC transporter permease [Lachnospiraceae bacterium]